MRPTGAGTQKGPASRLLTQPPACERGRHGSRLAVVRKPCTYPRGPASAFAPERTSWPVCRRRCSYPGISAAAGAAPIGPGRTILGRDRRPTAVNNRAARTVGPAGRVPRGYLRFKTRRCREAQERGAAPISGHARPLLARKLSEVVIRAAPKTRKPRCGAVSEALCRTRTGDPFLTMEVLYQLS